MSGAAMKGIRVDQLISRERLEPALPADVRAEIRRGTWTDHTAGLASGYVQANLVVLPADFAYDFLLFCVRNPKSCPVLDVTDPGSPIPRLVAPSADLRTDLPLYRVYEEGTLVEEPNSIEHRWRDDLVAFLLGCSFTFEHALARAGIPMRHWETRANVAMYRTTCQCVPAGRFRGPLVVSMRPIAADQTDRAVEISSRYREAHGAPIHLGEPSALGISDLDSPDWGVPAQFEPGDIPVFWACGVTPQAIAIEAGIPLMITHAPGHMFITDVPISVIEH